MNNPPLSLYVHIPWCVQKCPYCDFNSHGLKQAVPEMEYVSHLLNDLSQEAELIGDRVVESIFIGGGTPSLFSSEAIALLLHGISERVNLSEQAEITLEANPGTVEAEKFAAFKQVGINRLSIGVQSFQADKLEALGRIHDVSQAIKASQYANAAGFTHYNLDIMHGLPQQNIEDALADLQQAIDLAPPHLSWYQLTIEPNTQFHSQPPKLPDDDILWDIQEQGHQLLSQAGYQQYEISAYSKPSMQCAHNLNYWRFGDYLGIGCGAHGKITRNGEVVRRVKVKHPRGYMDLSKDYLDYQWQVQPSDYPFEFFMNRFRLLEPCPKADFERLTASALPLEVLQKLEKAVSQGLLAETSEHWQLTDLGKRYLNGLLETLV